MDRKKIKRQPHCLMETFLRSYVGIEDELMIEKLADLSHKQFKDIYDEIGTVKLRRLPFEDITSDDVQMGDVLLVLDKDNNPAPYVNPIRANFDKIIEEEQVKRSSMLYNDENHRQTYEEWLDTLDDMVSDIGVSNRQIKTLSLGRKIERKS